MESKKRKQSERAVRMAYNNRKECIKKKTMELCTLCDIKTCVVLFGPQGELDTWPQNPADVKAIIDTYKNHGKKSTTTNTNAGKKKEVSPDSNDELLDGLSRDAKEDLLRDIDFKIEAARRRTEFLKNRAFEEEEEETKINYRADSPQTILPFDQIPFDMPIWSLDDYDINGLKYFLPSSEMYLQPSPLHEVMSASMFSEQCDYGSLWNF